jgi:hypothetical protein
MDGAILKSAMIIPLGLSTFKGRTLYNIVAPESLA